MTIVRNALLSTVVVALASVAPNVGAQAADDANKSNNPLNPASGLNFQNYYSPDLYGSDKYTNDLLIRGTLLLPPMGFIPVPQLLRGTVPISTRPQLGGGYTTGLGDINIIDIFLGKAGPLEIGIDPQLTIPTASEDELGTGKWQAGLAAVAIHPSASGLIAGLLQWQQSFAGKSDRANVSTATFQPLVIHNLPRGWYLRSVGIWTFDLKNGNYYIPIGFGAGKAWKAGTTILNMFVEPQMDCGARRHRLSKVHGLAGLNLIFGK